MKMKFTFRVMETQLVEKQYTVEAFSMEEAMRMGERGDTVCESWIKNHGVVNREVLDLS